MLPHYIDVAVKIYHMILKKKLFKISGYELKVVIYFKITYNLEQLEFHVIF